MDLETTNIDSVNFDCDKYINHFLKTNNVKDLLKKNTEL